MQLSLNAHSSHVSADKTEFWVVIQNFRQRLRCPQDRPGYWYSDRSSATKHIGLHASKKAVLREIVVPIRYTHVVSLLVSVSNVAADDQGVELGVLLPLVQGVEKTFSPTDE